MTNLPPGPPPSTSQQGQRPAFVDTLRDDLLAGVPGHQRRRHRRHFAIVGTAGVLAVAMFVGGLWGTVGRQVEESILVGAESMVDDSAPGLTWTELTGAHATLSETAAGGRVAVHTVRMIGDAFVAFGTVAADGVSRPVGWRSEDGSTWDVVYDAESPIGVADSSLNSLERSSLIYGLTERNGTALAFGGADGEELAGLILRSVDGGKTWMSHARFDGHRLFTIEAVDDGFVMLGKVQGSTVWDEGADVIVFMDPNATAGDHAAIRNALDRDAAVKRYDFVDSAAAYDEFSGLFEDAPQIVESIDESILPTSYRVEFVADAAPDAEAARTRYEGSGVQRILAQPDVVQETGATLVWRSADGVEWQRPSPVTDELDGGDIRDIAADGSTVVAVGGEQRGGSVHAAAWLSIDGGRSWVEADVVAEPDDQRNIAMDSVVREGDGFFAIGTSTMATGGPSDVVTLLWRSSDGRTWTRADAGAIPDGQYITENMVAAGGDGRADVLAFSWSRTTPLLAFMSRSGGDFVEVRPPATLETAEDHSVHIAGSPTGHLVVVGEVSNSTTSDDEGEITVWSVAADG